MRIEGRRAMQSVKRTMIPIALAALAAGPALSAARPAAQHPHVEDIGPVSGFQESWGNEHRRGRALVVEDFDRDGYLDYFVGPRVALQVR